MNLDTSHHNNEKQKIDESQFNLKSLSSVLDSFYNPKNGDYSNIGANQEWLVMFQESLSAWELAPLLLYSNIKEVQYFGASTIETKVKTSWLSLSDENKSSILEKILYYLKNSIISTGSLTNNLINMNNNNGSISPILPSSPTSPSPSSPNNNNNNHNNNNTIGSVITTSNIVITRLCLAVSVIVCHSSLELWKDPIKDIISFAFPDPDNLEVFYPNQLLLLIELLTILPEELLNSDYISQEKRNKIGKEFFKYSSKIIQILCKIIRMPTTATTNSQQTLLYIKNSFKCFKSWVLFDIPPREYLEENQLIMHCFEPVSNNPILVEEFIILLDEIFSFMGGKVFKHYPNSLSPILERVIEMFTRYYVLALNEQNEMICHSIFFLFSHIADNHTKLLLNSSSQQGDKLFAAILEMCKTIDIESCDLLSPIISNIHSFHESKIDITKWHGLLLEFIEVFRVKSMFPLSTPSSTTHNNFASKEDSEKFYNFRTVACDSLLEIFTIIENKTLETLLSKLWNDIVQYPKSTWQSIESTIYLLGCLSEGLADDNVSFIPQLFQLLSQLPIQSTPLIKSTIVLAGKYANLLDQSNEFLEKIVSDFIPAFSNSELKLVASESFLSITKNENCSILLSKNIKQLIHLCNPYLFKGTDATNQINDESNINILESLLNIISALPKSEMLNLTLPIITPYIRVIEEFSQLSQAYQQKDIELFLSIMKILTKFCKIFDSPDSENISSTPNNNNNNNEQHPIIPIIQHLIIVFQNLLCNNKIQISDELLISISGFYKKTLLSCNKSSLIIASDINKQLTEIFCKNPLPSILNTLTIMVSVLPHNQYFEFLQQSLSAITPVVIDIWKKNVNGHNDRKLLKQLHNVHFQSKPLTYNLSIYPELTKEFYSLVTQFFKFNIPSLPIWIITPLFQIPLENLLNIHDKTTGRSCFGFISLLIRSSAEKKDLVQWQYVISELDKLFQQSIEYLIKQLLISISGASERSILPLISEIIYALVQSHPNLFRNIARSLLSVEGFPSSKITFQQKEKFLTTVMKHKVKEQMKAIEDFYLISLGISK